MNKKYFHRELDKGWRATWHPIMGQIWCYIECQLGFIVLLLVILLIHALFVIFQEVQRNGKAGIPAGRWPSLLSLTCPRSSGSGSGSELSLSSACSEYSSGSHTWAEGRGSSKQVGIIQLSSSFNLKYAELKYLCTCFFFNLL